MPIRRNTPENCTKKEIEAKERLIDRNKKVKKVPVDENLPETIHQRNIPLMLKHFRVKIYTGDPPGNNKFHCFRGGNLKWFYVC